MDVSSVLNSRLWSLREDLSPPVYRRSDWGLEGLSNTIKTKGEANAQQLSLLAKFVMLSGFFSLGPVLSCGFFGLELWWVRGGAMLES